MSHSFFPSHPLLSSYGHQLINEVQITNMLSGNPSLVSIVALIPTPHVMLGNGWGWHPHLASEHPKSMWSMGHKLPVVIRKMRETPSREPHLEQCQDGDPCARLLQGSPCQLNSRSVVTYAKALVALGKGAGHTGIYYDLQKQLPGFKAQLSHC